MPRCSPPRACDATCSRSRVSTDSATLPSNWTSARRTRVRLFFAIELSDAVRVALDHAVAPLRAAEPDLAWVPTEKLHLTMKFLGDVRDVDAERLKTAADLVAAHHRTFEMTLGGVGAFPNFRR